MKKQNNDTWLGFFKKTLKISTYLLLAFISIIFVAIYFTQFKPNQLTYLSDVPLVVLILILIASVNFLTEVTSNMATTAMLLPILVSLAVVLDLHPYYLLVSATLAASCAFMLPVATPPNTVVFGSGLLKIEDMFKKGLWLNLISIVTLTFTIYYVLPYFWDLVTPL